MAKTPKDSPTKVGDIIEMRGRPGKGVVYTLLARPGWMETVWDDGSDNPMICHQNELRKIEDVFPSDHPVAMTATDKLRFLHECGNLCDTIPNDKDAPDIKRDDTGRLLPEDMCKNRDGAI